ncbi:hypothetical protein RchiOBHm_Chr5g0015571 [Rosa chinensis]|uniref:Uncharacterized protein n=1 Tax=Rosa chinensis TaxID=74649 RepID=A0A2P6Q607_ROSCH|nr:hypothetical protein RchiOBHm_Chr5g0015571 [Rosa chinensis]
MRKKFQPSALHLANLIVPAPSQFSGHICSHFRLLPIVFDLSSVFLEKLSLLKGNNFANVFLKPKITDQVPSLRPQSDGEAQERDGATNAISASSPGPIAGTARRSRAFSKRNDSDSSR